MYLIVTNDFKQFLLAYVFITFPSLSKIFMYYINLLFYISFTFRSNTSRKFPRNCRALTDTVKLVKREFKKIMPPLVFSKISRFANKEIEMCTLYNTHKDKSKMRTCKWLM